MTRGARVGTIRDAMRCDERGFATCTVRSSAVRVCFEEDGAYWMVLESKQCATS